MTNDRAKVIDLIKKNLAHAASAESFGSQHEANAFAAMAQKIMLKHKLSLTDLEEQTEQSNDPMGTEYFNVAVACNWSRRSASGRQLWLESLTSALCRANFCRMWYIPGQKTVRLFGRTSDRETVKYLLTVLAREGERLAVLHERVARTTAAREGRPMPKQPKQAFLLGYTTALQERIKKERESVMTEAKAMSGGTALVRVNKLEDQITQYVAQFKSGKGTALNANINDGASYYAGKKAGESQSMNKGVGNNPTITLNITGRR